MTVYLINISLLILGYAIWINKRNVNGKAYFCIQATAQWVLLSGLRSTSIGADTGRYEIIFEQVKNIGWNQIFEIAKYSWIANSDYKDPGFYLIQKIFQIFSTDYQVFLVVVAITFFVPLSLIHISEPTRRS